MNKKTLTIIGLALVTSLIFSSCSNSEEISHNDESWNSMEKNVEMENDLEMENIENMETHEISENSFSYLDFSEELLAKAKMENKNIALFFHADWCPTCVKLEKEINENLSMLPDNSVVFNVNYDDSKEMKKMYWVTTQTTFIFLKDWSDEFAKKVWPSVSDIKTMLMN